MTFSWRSRRRSPHASLISGCILIAVGLWDLFFVLFRSEGVLFTVLAALLLLVGGINVVQGLRK